MGNGLVTAKRNLWKEDRKLLSPAFKYQRFDDFLAIFNKHSRILVEILDKNVAQCEVNLHPILCRAAMDKIMESALGQPSTFQYKIDARFLKAVHMALKNIRTRLISPWLDLLPIIWNVFGLGRKEEKIKQSFSNVVSKIITERKKVLKNKIQGNETETSMPLMDVLLTCKSDHDILSHLISIVFAGFETVSSAMNYTLFLLACNPQCQEKVHEEIEHVFKNDLERNVSFRDIAELKYLEMCVKEAMRLYPPAPNLIRKVPEDIVLDDGLIIPAGCNVALCLYEIHRDPADFPDPETFDPERFVKNRHPYAYIPFSMGPRNYLGLRYAMMQIKVVLTHILRHFEVSTTLKREDLKLLSGMVLEPSPSILLTLNPRKVKI